MARSQDQETVVQWGGLEEKVSVWTSVPKVVRQLSRRGYKPKEVRNGKDGKPHSWLFDLPPGSFRFVRPRGPRITANVPDQGKYLANWRLKRKTGTKLPTDPT